MEKILKQHNNKIELEDIPFKRSLSLEPLIEFWENSLGESSIMDSIIIKPTLEKLQNTPELRGEINDLSVLKKHKDLVDILMSSIYAPAQRHNQLAASLIPFEFTVFYSTNLYDNKVGLTEDEIKRSFADYVSKSIFAKTMKAYSFILHQMYGVENNADYPMIFKLKDKNSALDKYYQLTFDSKFMKVVVNGEKPSLSENCIQQLLEAPTNLMLWMKKLPPERFEIHGFTTVIAVDVTSQEVLSQLKHNLLEKDSIISSEKFGELENNLQNYFGSNNIKLGLAYMPTSKNVLQSGKTVGNSFILNDLCRFSCGDLSESVYEEAIERKKSIVIEDLVSYPDKSVVEEEILKLGIKNIIIAPLYDGEDFIGILEIGSTVPRDLTSYDKFRVKELLSLFTIAVKRSQEEQQNQIQAIIKEECTAIHPVVEWRFVEAAVNLIEKRQSEKNASMESIVFDNVYPLYAVSDIKNSSQFRNESIQLDLVQHMTQVQNILREALKKRPLPILDELNFRISQYMKEIKDGLSSGDEVSVLDFLNGEISKVFEHLKTDESSLAGMINDYEKLLDPNINSFYDKRKDYESSVSLINETISNYLDEAETEAQKMFPHYFEKYKTDGVEHGIYIGDSLVNDRNFDKLYLKNLRLWQLITVCEIARKTNELLPSLPVPLETTHLILVQNNPLSIRFRLDEKKFDVDGTYNIRYEIMKKRIDKALIADTNERLVQPGKIAIVYSQNKEVAEYSKYISYLKTKGYLKNETEYLDLESLQGVSGLRAIRVTVNLEAGSGLLNKKELENVVRNIKESVN